MAEARRGLGRGLDSLIPGRPSPDPDLGSADGGAAVRGFDRVPLGEVHPNPDQPRRFFDEEALSELAASITEVGVLQPIVVRQRPAGGYELIAGERRLRAAGRAGLTEIPVMIRDEDDPEGLSLVGALIENIQREDLSPLEEAAGFQALLDEHGMTHEEVATAVGKSRSAITNTIRLLQLPAVVQRMVERGDLSAGHGRTLLAIEDQAYLEHVAGRAVAEDWSVRHLEEAVKVRQPDKKTKRRRSSSVRPVEIVELESRLRDQLDTRVKIDYGNKKGTVQIGFGSLEELENLYLRFFS